jgi:NAD(P)-dependent dehydrogenase (short-subunit alcohol dehydrogenase family)
MSQLPVAAITGGTSGIGLATALHLAARGYRISVCGRDAGRLMEAARQLSAIREPAHAMTVPIDLTQTGAASQFIHATQSAWGRIDVLVNSAGVAVRAPVAELSDEALDRLLRANVVATFGTCRAVIPIMRNAGRGCIVNVSSQAAIDPFPGFAVYGACKAWVDRFTNSLAAEVRRDGISVFSVQPGAVETPMLRGLFPDFPNDQALQPDDVAELIVRLADPAWNHCTGAMIPIRVS